MTFFVSIASQILGFLTLLSQIVIFMIVYLLVTSNKKALAHIGKYGIPAALSIAIASLVGSLFYSEIAGFPPCELCLIQRFIMYPQTILLSVVLLKKNTGLFSAILVFLGLGIIVGLYQYLLQFGIVSSVCDILNSAVSCSRRYIFELGYITIPLMSLTAFILMFLLVFLGKNHHRGNITPSQML